ncbi:MAG: nucleoside 2-deoxyribosyltransferase [Clostridia bacterium]|nr:nucleoside 2-deoxyribosyltransferase [Clostridia bacterium]
MKIYLASPFFRGEERPNVEKARDILQSRGFDVFVPMEHKIENGENLPNDVWAKAVFEMDKNAIDECDVLVCLYYGLYSDSGTAWEVGYAVAKRKKVIVVHIDTVQESSLMVSSCADANLRNINELQTIDIKKLENNGFYGHTEQK